MIDPIEGTPITSIRIIRSSSEPNEEKEVVVKDKNIIENIMNGFSEVKLRETKIRDVDPTSRYQYYLIISIDRPRISGLKFGITVYDKKNIEIYDGDKTKHPLHTYQITNEYSSETVENVFK